MKDFRDQTEDENVFAFVLGGSAECFHGQSGDGHADVNKAFVVEIRLDVVGIVEQHAPLFQKADVVLVAVLIKRDKKIGFVAGGENFAGAHADLEDRRTAGDGGGNRHVSHDIVIAAAGEAREKSARALNAVLRISRETDDGVVDAFGAKIGPVRCRGGRRGGSAVRGIGFRQVRRRIHVRQTISGKEENVECRMSNLGKERFAREMKRLSSNRRDVLLHVPPTSGTLRVSRELRRGRRSARGHRPLHWLIDAPYYLSSASCPPKVDRPRNSIGPTLFSAIVRSSC